RTFAHQFKRKHLGGQGMYTKSRALLDAIEDRIRMASVQYRAARKVLWALRGASDWEKVLQELRPDDVRGMNERLMNDSEKEESWKARALAGLPADGVGKDLDEYGEPVELIVLFNLETGEGCRLLSWIWYTASTSADTAGDGKLHTGTDLPTVQGMEADNVSDIQVEWLKARARADCWREELILLEEEMRRTLVFCTWKANWWLKRAAPRTDVSPELAEGLQTYALE
ncbi:hypothetical protein B0H17DRAFT_931964, partial [Mycena rosella]